MVSLESRFYCLYCMEIHGADRAALIYKTAWQTVKGETFRAGECNKEIPKDCFIINDQKIGQ